VSGPVNTTADHALHPAAHEGQPEKGTAKAGVRGRHLVVGLVALHVVCCGLPLLIAAGVLGGTGALLSSPVLLAVGVLVLLAAGAVAVRRLRGSGPAGPDACCLPAQQTDSRAAVRGTDSDGGHR